MLQSAAAIVSHTPIYVWFLLAMVLLRAWQATRVRTTGLYGPLVLPGLIVALGLASLLAKPASVVEGVIWLGALVLGAMMGRPLGHYLLLRVEAGPPVRLHLRGSWLIFWLILVIFSLRYGMAVFDAVDPAVAGLPLLRLIEVMVRGGLSGLLVGRGVGVLLAARAMARTKTLSR